MTLQEFYDRIGGDYKATISRLPRTGSWLSAPATR